MSIPNFFPTGHEVGSSSSLVEAPQPCRQLSFSEIQVATKNFDESLVIGRGGFGKVYKGTIINGASLLTVAIKRLESTSNQGATEFWAEIEMLSQFRDPHLVSLIGYCNDGQEMILVYEYMPNGTLADRLHKSRAPLTWMRRIKICLEAARGLEYLHMDLGVKPIVIHRDVKSSNILLDSSWSAKIADFGLSKAGPTNQPITYVNTLVRGTFGYMDPDYFQTGKLTRKSDVYAFGVVMLEALCGKKALDTSIDDEHWGLATWAQDSIKEGKLKQIVDSNLRGSVSSKCLKEFAQLANRCLHSHPKRRPTMAEVVAGLESVLALHEKNNHRLQPSGMTVFGKMVPSFFSTSGEGTSEKSLELYLITVAGEDQILHQFDFGTLSVATKNFSDANLISQNFYGSMHKGKLPNGLDIAVVGPYSHKDYDLCMNEVSILVRLEHKNLAHLLGYSIKGVNVYLLYDVAPYATLDRLLFDTNRAPLDWDARYKILLGVARVLLYLHKHDPNWVIHRDIKPSNILLDESLDPQLFGFYYAISTSIHHTDHIEVETLCGTVGYMPQEIFQGGRFSAKTDIYSFGVLFLETISGPSVHNCIGSHTLFAWVWSNWVEGTYSNVFDHRINVDQTLMKRFIQIGLLCIQYEAMERPTMEEVVGMLLGSSSIDLPIPKDPSAFRIREDSDSKDPSHCFSPCTFAGTSLKSLELYLITVAREDQILHQFDFGTLSVATENFSEANLISQNIDGSMHKGKLPNGLNIAVVGPYSDHEYYELCMNEVSMLVKLEHKNVVQLLGYCIKGVNVYLLYDVAPYATLDCLLFDTNYHASLDWDARYKIMLGVARVLLYLHKHDPNSVIHRDIKPSNILLDESLDPQLFGFYYAISTSIHHTDHTELEPIRGTRGYLAPELLYGVRISAKIDIYSFGVLFLETISGHSVQSRIGSYPLLAMVWSNWVKGTYSSFDLIINVDQTLMKRFVHIGLLCVQYIAMERPTMEEVVGMLRGTSSIDLPIPKDPCPPGKAFW